MAETAATTGTETGIATHLGATTHLPEDEAADQEVLEGAEGMSGVLEVVEGTGTEEAIIVTKAVVMTTDGIDPQTDGTTIEREMIGMVVVETANANVNESEKGTWKGVLRRQQNAQANTPASASASHSNHGDVARETSGGPEDGEDMDAENEDDSAMMAMMGLAGFGTTKACPFAQAAALVLTVSQGKHVLGNQEGGANVKKVRTWRQYMNRRGGFNRPLDKIK